MKTRLNAALAIMLLALSPQAAYSADLCQCVEYVKRKIGYTGSLTGCSTCGAYLAGNNLVAAGYRWSGTPAVGDIAVFQRNFVSVDGQYFDRTNGHIAFVTGTNYNASNNTWTLFLRGSNQGTPWNTDANCYNVSIIVRTYQNFTSESQRTVSFYRK